VVTISRAPFAQCGAELRHTHVRRGPPARKSSRGGAKTSTTSVSSGKETFVLDVAGNHCNIALDHRPSTIDHRPPIAPCENPSCPRASKRSARADADEKRHVRPRSFCWHQISCGPYWLWPDCTSPPRSCICSIIAMAPCGGCCQNASPPCFNASWWDTVNHVYDNCAICNLQRCAHPTSNA
jgi:hypothetical protein